MKTIKLSKRNTEHVAGNTYGWTPDNAEPYRLIVEDGIEIDTGGGGIKCGILYWRNMQVPSAGSSKIDCRIVRPEGCTRVHWQERLDGIVDVSDGCYDDILARVCPHIDEILALDKWSKCERWIIESWKRFSEGRED